VSASHKTGAFFDLDGTLLPAPSLEWRFIGYLLSRDVIGDANLARWLARFAKTLLRGSRAAVEANKFHLAGLRESLAADWEKSLGSDSLPFFPPGIECISWHLAQGHHVSLVSGTLDPLVRVALRHFRSPIISCATKLETCNGAWTGRLMGEQIVGDAKARAIRALAQELDLNLDFSYAYGNRMSDLAMLESVAFPVAVNPSARLARRARRCGWRVCRWSEIEPVPGSAHTRLLEPKEAR
jgi:HAD superfamily hydrolase (TIGR01490 family)